MDIDYKKLGMELESALRSLILKPAKRGHSFSTSSGVRQI